MTLDPHPPRFGAGRLRRRALLGLVVGFACVVLAPVAVAAETEPVRVPPPFLGLETSEEVIAHIRAHEGLRLEAYQDARGVWLIGYGHARTASPGMTISQAQAEALLRADLRAKEAVIADQVTVPLAAHEFSALVSFVYTIGEGNFARSRVLRHLNAGERAAAGDAFRNWTRTRVDGELVPVPGLIGRRERERAVFLGLPRDE